MNLMHGIVGHQGHRAVRQSHHGTRMGLSHEISGSNAAALGQHMIGKHGQVTGNVPVGLVIVPVLVHAATTALNIQHLVSRHHGRNVGGSHKAVVVRPRVGGSHHALTTGNSPLGIRCSQQQAAGLGHQPANPVLRRRGKRESQGAVILFAHLEIVKVIGLAQPHRLRLGLCGSQDKALLEYIHQRREPVDVPERGKTPHQGLPGWGDALRNRGHIVPQGILRGGRQVRYLSLQVSYTSRNRCGSRRPLDDAGKRIDKGEVNQVKAILRNRPGTGKGRVRGNAVRTAVGGPT